MYEKPVDHIRGQEIENFNNTYSIHALLIGVGFIADSNSSKFEYLGHILQSMYYYPNGQTIYIKYDNLIDIIDIHTSDGFVFDHAFDIYVHYYNDRDLYKALNWESDTQINMTKLQTQTQPQPQLYPLAQPLHNQQWQYQAPQPPLPPPNYNTYPYPTMDIDFVLDNSTPKEYLKLDDCLHDKDSLVFLLATYISHKTDIPVSTIIVLILSVWSGLTSKRYQCSYKDGRTVSIGLYAVLEQSSGVGKSVALSMLLESFKNTIESMIYDIKASIQSYEDICDKLKVSLAGCTTKEDKATFKKQIQETNNILKKLKKNCNRLQWLMPITNVTPAALDEMLTATGGFFFAATSELGFLISMLGLRQGSKYNNNDLLLNGREGGYVNGNHLGRKSYRGQVRGAITSFAQEGGIGTLLAASDNTGLAERFLMVSEPSRIGYRDRITEKVNGDHILQLYAKRCECFKIYIDDENALNHDSLITLRISDVGWRHILNFEQELENKMRPGAELSHHILQRVNGKTKMQVMGVAANSYLLHTENPPTSASDNPFIPDEFVVMAINIFRQLIFGFRSYCERKGLISDVAQLTAVYNVFVGKGENASYTDQELKKRLQQVKPFKDMEEPRKAIQRALEYLEQHYVLLKDGNERYFKNPVQLNSNYR